MAALAGDGIDATSYDFSTQETQHLTVVENTVAILFPSLPVVGYAKTILEGMNEAILVGDVGVEPVPLKASFNPAWHEGSAFFRCSRRLCRGRKWTNKLDWYKTVPITRSGGCTCGTDKGNKEKELLNGEELHSW